MAEIDRRQSDERRSSKRYEVSIDVEWETHLGKHAGTLSDISEKGCFILSSVDMSDGELVKVWVPLSDGMSVEFMGQVANYVSDIGFAVHFLSLSDAQKDFLASFVALHANDVAR
jgi:hypothetical protein